MSLVMSHNNSCDRATIKCLLFDMCRYVNRLNDPNPKHITWCINNNPVEYTYSSDEYDRRMNPIDHRLFYVAKIIRSLGDFENYNFDGGYGLLVRQNKRELPKHKKQGSPFQPNIIL
jgi:hypothetical protein